MKLIPNWKKVLRKASSIKWMVLAFVMTGAEAAIQFIGTDWIPVRKGVLPLVVMGLIGGAFVARLIAQKSMEDDE